MTREDSTAGEGSGGSAGGADGAARADGGNGQQETVEGTETPPPWQRGTTSAVSGSGETEPAGAAGGSSSSDGSGSSDSSATSAAAVPADGEETEKIPYPFRESGSDGSDSDAGPDGRTSVSMSGIAGVRANATAASSQSGARRPNRGPRRASLQVRRVDPWSVLKLALVLSVTLFFVWMIAVAVLYGVLGGMGVWDQLNGTFSELTQPENSIGEPLISPGRIFGVAMIIGAVNIVLFTALATVAAFIYNVAADFVGGVEVTLSERE